MFLKRRQMCNREDQKRERHILADLAQGTLKNRWCFVGMYVCVLLYTHCFCSPPLYILFALVCSVLYPPTDLSDHNFKLSLGIKRQKSVPIKKMQKFNQMLHAILKWWHLSFIMLLFEFDGLSWLRLVLSFFFLKSW